MKTRYETPDAVVHDINALVEDARALIQATSEVTDDKVAQARHRLEGALSSARSKLGDVQEQAREGLDAAASSVRRHPYESLAIALGVGAFIGFLATRRN
ncbi:MAG: YqjD family protein [Limisphaerales bacterium]